MGKDWTREAAECATYIGDHHMRAHRGATPYGRRGVAIAFGNDDYREDPRTQKAVELLVGELERRGWPVLGFATAPSDGYTWALLVKTSDVGELFKMVWRSWAEALGTSLNDGFAALQYGVALDEACKIADLICA